MSKLTKETYYQDSRVSNSSLNWILPECGGSLAKYEQFALFPSEQEDSEAMRLGTLLHKYMETRSMETFERTTTPSAAVIKIAETVVDNLPHFASQPPDVVEAEVLRVARFNEYHNDWKDATLSKNLMSNAGLFMMQLAKARETNHVLVSEEELTLLETASEQLKKAIPWNFDSSVIPPFCKEGDKWEIFREKIIEFEIFDVPFKAMLDLVVVNYTKKIFWVLDLKTTSSALSTYLGYKTEGFVINPKTNVKSIEEFDVPGFYLLKWNVHRQLAVYQRAAMCEFLGFTPAGDPTIIACETKLPFEVRLHNVPYEELVVGDRRALTALEMLKKAGLVGVGL
jgi:hypothetical protein